MAIEETEWWRAVVGEYPTGVSLLTALQPNGEPVGMVIGSFTPISQDPPLVGFFGDDASATFKQIVGTERFAVSVFGESHDGLVRSFIRKDEDRFTQAGLDRTDSGLIRITDAVAWFEARTESVQRYGDHQMVVGRVERFGVGEAEAGSPLIYRRGGFGSFAIPADAMDPRIVGDRLAAAQAAAEMLAPVARKIDRDIAITTLVGESVVVVGMVPAKESATAADGPDTGPFRAIGLTLPFAAPVEPLFAAWASDHNRSLWIERARHLVGSVDRRGVEKQLDTIRQRRYGVSVDQDLTARFLGLITDPTAERESYARLWSEYASQTIESASSALALGDIAAIQVPVFDNAGHVALVLTVSDIGPFDDDKAIDDFAADLIDAAASASKAITRQPRGRS